VRQLPTPAHATALPESIAGDMLRLSTYAEVDEALRSPLLEQASHPRAELLGGSTRVDFPLKGSLQSLDGQEHLDRRRAYAALFRRAALAGYEQDHLIPALQSRLAALRTATSTSEIEADIVPLMRSAALAVTATIIGLDGTDDASREQALLDISERLSEGGGVYWLTGDHERVTTAAVEAREHFMADFGQPALDKRRRAMEAMAHQEPPSNSSNDIISMVLGGAAGIDVMRGLDVVNELTFFVAASFNTPTKLVPHVVVELDAWAHTHPNERHLLGDPVFVYAATQEALRLHVAAPILLRKPAATLTLRSGVTLEQGSIVALDLGAANRDPEAFGTNSDRFEPGRHHASGVPAYGLAFGSGQHKCIGAPLTISPEAPKDAGSAVGIMVRLLLEFEAAGMRLDPSNPPRRRTDTIRDEYATCPVIFDRLSVGVN
jgi:cytochrome P450